MPGLETDTDPDQADARPQSVTCWCSGLRRRTASQSSVRVLRAFASPSAEVRGTGRGRKCCKSASGPSTSAELEPVGMYAVRPTFSDGHNTGIYSWDYLHKLCNEQEPCGATICAAGTGRSTT